MTTVAELIEFLQTLPADAEVDVLAERQGQYSTYTEFEPLELPDEWGNSDNLEVFDFRKNQFVKEGDPRFGKVYLSFGNT